MGRGRVGDDGPGEDPYEYAPEVEEPHAPTDPAEPEVVEAGAGAEASGGTARDLVTRRRPAPCATGAGSGDETKADEARRRSERPAPRAPTSRRTRLIEAGHAGNVVAIDRKRRRP